MIPASSYAVADRSRCYQRNGAAMPQVSDADLVEELATARRELAEALERQAVTDDVLRVIASSSEDLHPVFDAILSNATRVRGQVRRSLSVRT